MPAGMRVNGNAPTSPIGHPDVLWGIPGQGGLLTEWAETVPDLTWPDSVRTFGRMRRDARITALLASYFLPIIRTTWAVDPEGVDRSEAVDLVASDLGLPILGEKGRQPDSPVRGFTFHDHVRLALLSKVYGHFPFERWFEVRDGRTHLAGVQERQPHTISIIDIADDGLVSQVWQNTQNEPIPANRLTWYVNEREGANWAGVSILRSCYTPWILKHETLRVHATSIRRFGMGVPNVEAPPGGTPGQIAQAQQLAAQMRVGDTAGAGLPNGFKLNLTGLSGSVPDALGFLTYLNQEITTSALAQIIELGHGTYGTRALGESFLDLFLLALQASADSIGDTATYGDPAMPGIARSLVEYNWGEGEPVPRIVATDVGDRHEITAQAVSAMITSGALSPDPNLEAFLREAWGLPERSEDFPPPPVEVPWVPKGKGGPPAAAPEPAGDAPAAQPSPASQPGSAGTPGENATTQARRPVPPARPARAARRDRWWRPFRRQQAKAAPAGLRRPLSDVEAGAGMEPLVILAESQSAAEGLLKAWEPVGRAMRQDLAEQVAAAVDDGHPERLADLRPDTAAAAAMLTTAMQDMAWTGAQRLIREAATQGVTIDPAKVEVDDARLGRLAQARAGLIAARLAAAATRATLHIVAATAGEDAGQLVNVHLDGLSPAPLQGELQAAMEAAQNMGRFEAMTAGINDGYIATCWSSEILDRSTCFACENIDGYQYPSPAEAEIDYPGGGYVECAGLERCRGTIVVTWDQGNQSAADQLIAGDLGGGLPGGVSISDLMTADARFSELPQGLLDQINGQYGAESLRVVVDGGKSFYTDDKMVIRGTIHDAAGNQVGEFERQVTRAKDGSLWVEHSRLEIDAARQGQGFASAFNKQMEGLYVKAGIKEIRLNADITVGGFAWARRGYDFASQKAAEVIGDRYRMVVLVAKSVAKDTAIPESTTGIGRAAIELANDPAALSQAENLIARLAAEKFGSAAYPTPFEFSNVGWKAGATSWPGKDIMLGTGWDAVKLL